MKSSTNFIKILKRILIIFTITVIIITIMAAESIVEQGLWDIGIALLALDVISITITCCVTTAEDVNDLNGKFS